MVTGLSTAGTFAIVAALSAAASAPNTASAESADDALSADEYTPDPAVEEIVVIELHRTVYVDEFGRPVDPTQVPVTASVEPPSTTKKATTTTPTKKATKKRVPKKKATPKCTGSTC